MLKDLIEKHSEILNTETNISELNVIDYLVTESGKNDFNIIINDMSNISNEINTLEVQLEQLNTETGLELYLTEQGYEEQLKTESAVDIAKDVIEKIKKAIKWLIDKFIILVNKIKNILFSTTSKLDKIFNLLKKEIKSINNLPDDSLLDISTFGEKFPIVADFGKKDNVLKIVKTINDSIYVLNKIGDPVKFDKHVNWLDGWSNITFNPGRYVMGVLKFKPVIEYLYCDTENSKLEIKSLDTKSTYNVNNKKVLNKNDILEIIEKCLDVNSSFGLFVKEIEKSIKKLNNLNPDENSKFYNINNIEHNVSVGVNSCVTFLKHYEPSMNDLAFIIAKNIKAYDLAYKDNKDTTWIDEGRY